jgi:5'-nucleotidase
MSKPLILVCNDDGIFSKGIRTLIEVMSELGEVVVVAPDSPQSGMGHAITIGNTLRLESSDLFPGIVAYECSGTPADCVKLAKHHVLKGRKPDLVVSGINHGSNSSISVLYSGTMSAAIEAALEGLPAIGFSLCDYDAHADFTHVKKYVKQIATEVLTNGLSKGITLNVNFPPINKAMHAGKRNLMSALIHMAEDIFGWQEVLKTKMLVRTRTNGPYQMAMFL